MGGRCETYLIDVPTAFLAGSVLAWVARPLLVARRPDPFGPSFLTAVGFALLYSLAVGWAAWKAPDWMLSYLVPVNALGLPLAVFHLGFVLACLLAAASAHTLVAVLLQRERPIFAGLVCLGGALLLAGLWGLSLDRYLVVGTEAQWRAGTATPLAGSEVAAGFHLLGAILALAFGLPAVALHRAGRSLRVHR